MVDPNEKPSEWKYIFVDLEALGFAPVIGRSFISTDQELLFLFDLMFRELENQPDEWQEQFCLLLPVFFTRSPAERAEPTAYASQCHG